MAKERALIEKLTKMVPAIGKSTAEGLKKFRTEASRVLNASDTHSSGVLQAAGELIGATKQREAALQAEHFARAKSDSSIAWHVCRGCGMRKPADDSYFGFGFRDGRGKTKCKACLRGETKDYHSADPSIGRERAARLGASRNDDARFVELTTMRRREQQGNTCAYCGDSLGRDGQLDHVVPKDDGGTDDPKNLVLACRSCNQVKGRKSADEFLRYRQRHGLRIRPGGFYTP